MERQKLMPIKQTKSAIKGVKNLQQIEDKNTKVLLRDVFSVNREKRDRSKSEHVRVKNK